MGLLYTRALTNGIENQCDPAHIVANFTNFQGILN